ncbi:hypothetical protein KFE25_010570 [Diacronema lutheri]|uniref:Uncharacterized protein n=1 Tax=Diacronema lutheri TaxID=2081491 RepID=A0A8J5XCW8_DIALT|nr:hypothetical protein KFE25_010570 [Diacronema lutheri]
MTKANREDALLATTARRTRAKTSLNANEQPTRVQTTYDRLEAFVHLHPVVFAKMLDSRGSTSARRAAPRADDRLTADVACQASPDFVRSPAAFSSGVPESLGAHAAVSHSSEDGAVASTRSLAAKRRCKRLLSAHE